MSPKFEDQPEEVRDRFVEKAGELVDHLYWCTRTWTAWEVNTMSESDFIEASQDVGILDDVAGQMWGFFVSIRRDVPDSTEPPARVPLAEQELQVALDVLSDNGGDGETELWALDRLELYGVLVGTPPAYGNRVGSSSLAQGASRSATEAHARSGSRALSTSYFRFCSWSASGPLGIVGTFTRLKCGSGARAGTRSLAWSYSGTWSS